MTPIPRRVGDRPNFKQLSPAENDEFLRKQAGFEAAYRTTGDPQVLWHALLHLWASKQTPPAWIVRDLGSALIERRTDEVAERYRERMRHVQRYVAVQDLRDAGHTKDSALDQAAESPALAMQRAAAERGTIASSYDRVRKDLKRRGRESEFFYLVELVPEAHALAPTADSTLWTADSTIPINAGDPAASASAPWFMRIAKR